jgi:hypothetical protein
MVTVICIYIATVLLTWYPLVNDMSTQGYSTFPSWESFRHFVTISDLIFGTVVALIPVLNVLFTIVIAVDCFISATKNIHPLRRK